MPLKPEYSNLYKKKIVIYNEFYFSHIYLFFSHLLLMLWCIVKMALLVLTVQKYTKCRFIPLNSICNFVY